MSNHTPIVNVRIPQDVKQEIDAVAELSGHTRSDVIKACIKAALPFVRRKVEEQVKAQPQE